MGGPMLIIRSAAWVPIKVSYLLDKARGCRSGGRSARDSSGDRREHHQLGKPLERLTEDVPVRVGSNGVSRVLDDSHRVALWEGAEAVLGGCVLVIGHLDGARAQPMSEGEESGGQRWAHALELQPWHRDR